MKKLVPMPEHQGEAAAARRDQLLERLRYNMITRDEALELNGILLKEEEAAKKRGDTATLIAVALGLALLAAIVAKSK